MKTKFVEVTVIRIETASYLVPIESRPEPWAGKYDLDLAQQEVMNMDAEDRLPEENVKTSWQVRLTPQEIFQLS